jgi:hypothetical protein
LNPESHTSGIPIAWGKEEEEKVLKDPGFLCRTPDFLAVNFSPQTPTSLRQTMSSPDAIYAVEAAAAAKKPIWQSIRENPKYVFIAFFAS